MIIEAKFYVCSLGGALIPSTLKFRSGGATSTQVIVTIVDDSTVESLQEQFSVQISSTNPRVIVQQDMADITVIDDDGKQEF